MNKREFGLISLALLATVPAIPQRSLAESLLIRDVTIIDCTGRAPQPDMSVLISKDRIVRLAPASKLKPPKGAEVLDGRGKFLIPGVWNMHVHLGAYADGKQALAMYIAEGITGLRDMGSPLEDILRLRQEVNAGKIQGPHLVVAGPIIQGPLPFQMPLFISVKDATGGRQTVDMLRSRGVDFIKVQDWIPHDFYVAVAEEAKRDNIQFVGHIPPTVLPEEASDLGQRSIEHLGGQFWGVLIGASTRESELHAEEVQMYQDSLTAAERKQSPPPLHMLASFTRAIVESYDRQKAAALVARFRENQTWQCPTLVVLHTLWTSGSSKYTTEDMHWADRLLDKDTELVRIMDRAGVGLLAGTDLPPNAKDGTIHDELTDLVDAGLTPMQALQTATRNPAEFLGNLESMGTVEPGKIADLVLLNANPLHDIHNTRKIFAVLVQGHLILRPTNGH